MRPEKEPTMPSDINNWIGCPICRQQNSFSGIGHWAWHNVCRAELNPVALVAFIEGRKLGEAGDSIVRYVITVTGMNIAAMRKALAEEAAESATSLPARVGSPDEGTLIGSATSTSSSLGVLTGIETARQTDERKS